MVDPNEIQKHMEVVGSDGQHVGLVDDLGIKLTKNDPIAHDQHHFLRMDQVDSIKDGKVTLNLSAADAIADEKVVEN